MPTSKTFDHLSACDSDAMKPTIAASRMAGPKLLAGAVVYMMTARKINASATDLLDWLWPSTLVTGTMKRLDATVSATRTTSGAMPLQPSNGKRIVETIPESNINVPTTVTAASNNDLFQLSLGMNYPEISEGTELVRDSMGRRISRGVAEARQWPTLLAT